MMMKKIAALALAAVMAVGVAVPAAQAAPTAATATRPTTHVHDASVIMAVEAVNADRAREGLRPVAYSPQLSALTKAHLNDRAPVTTPYPDRYADVDFGGLFANAYGDRMIDAEVSWWSSNQTWWAVHDPGPDPLEFGELNASQLTSGWNLWLPAAKYVGVSVRYLPGGHLETFAVVADVVPGTLSAGPLPNLDRTVAVQAAELRAAYGTTNARVSKAKKAVKTAKASVIKARKVAKSKVDRERRKYLAGEATKEYRRAVSDYRAATKHQATARKHHSAARKHIAAKNVTGTYFATYLTGEPAKQARASASRTVAHSKKASYHLRRALKDAPKAGR
jgi:hypothetical protein